MKTVKKTNNQGKVYEYVETGKPLTQNPMSDRGFRDTSSVGRNTVEDQMVDLMDEVQLFRDLEPELKEALKTKDVKSMLKGASTWALAQTIYIAKNSQSDAVRAQALKDILDRAGYKPVDKQATLNMNDLTEGEIDAALHSLLKETNLGTERPNKGLKSGVKGSTTRTSSAKTKTEAKE